jgi:hypothetical protein
MHFALFPFVVAAILATGSNAEDKKTLTVTAVAHELSHHTGEEHDRLYRH